MLDLRTIARALGGEVNAGQVRAPGPGHSAADRSLSVRLDNAAPDGFVVHSFAGDDPIRCRDYVREKAGLPAFKPYSGNGRRPVVDIDKALAAAFATQRDATPKSRVVAAYDYSDATGALLYQVIRYEPKDFRQRRPDGSGGWINQLDDIARVPYRLPDLAKYPDATVFVTEGEKDADRVAELGHCATTVACGKWTADCVKALAGRDVLILEDNDEPGRKKALAAATALHGTAKSIRIVQLPDLPDKGDVSDWLDASPSRADKFVDTCMSAPVWKHDMSATANTWNFHGADAPSAPRWLVKYIIPETGVGLMAGQWGTFKTTGALDLSVSVMADQPFAGHYPIKRPGGVLFFAVEGAGMLERRLAAIAAHRGITEPLPFAWRAECPPLTAKDAADTLCALVKEAADEIEQRFHVPVSLIWIDTVIAAAKYDASGDDNDTATAQKVMAVLAEVARRTGAFVIGIDHFGKVIDTGTRGSSAKEGGADTVLALLADRELSGSVKNTRLALRKQRDGASGFTIAFVAREIETGTDEDGDPITAVIIDWQATVPAAAAQPEAKWSPSIQLLRRVLMSMLADAGREVHPFADGPLVRACDLELVRAEFYRQYPADGTDKQKAAARQKAFVRAINAAQSRSLITTREVDGEQLVWLTTVEPNEATNG